MDVDRGATRFSGREFGVQDLTLIRQVVDGCSGLSRMELAHTICDLLGWKRPNGSLKGRECREFLERLESRGIVGLPEKRRRRPKGSRTSVPHTARGDPARTLIGTVREFDPIVVDQVRDRAQRLWFRELVGRYHDLGHAVPFGAHLRYLAFVSKPERAVVGCLQFSSPAWRMGARDRWIGWDDATRRVNLQKVVSNSRFLILPWVRIRNLASAVLALAAQRVVEDWQDRYAVRPLLLETLVDPRRYTGACYRAANWTALGETAGRGRMDRGHRRQGADVKTVLVYPLVRDAAHQLRNS